MTNNIKQYYDHSDYACRDSEAHRRKPEPEQAYRTAFARDRDRILYSGAYRRYHGKTQVFSFANLFDEEMTNRNLHTTYVSQISRTIGKNLGLNLELIEAIALGHDLGHTPFGHEGEKALSKICQARGIGGFHHNLQSLHIVDNISRKGRGLNLTFQVRDGIISHDGEVHTEHIYPQRNKTEQDIQTFIKAKKQNDNLQMMPATLEGCVVKISDTIAYIGQDIEDAIRLGLLKKKDIPKDCATHLGDTNSRIINSLVTSVVNNSIEQDYICMDEETAFYLKKLKDFNYARIYNPKNDQTLINKIEMCMTILFDKYLKDIKFENHNSKIFKHFLKQKNKRYLSSFSLVEKVRDFISTMTDRYFNEEIKDYLLLWK